MDDRLGYNWVGAENAFTKLDEAKIIIDNVIWRMLGYNLVNNLHCRYAGNFSVRLALCLPTSIVI